MATRNGTATSYCFAHQSSRDRCNLDAFAVQLLGRDGRLRPALRSILSAMAKRQFCCRYWLWSDGACASRMSHERSFTSGESEQRHVQ